MRIRRKESPGNLASGVEQSKHFIIRYARTNARTGAEEGLGATSRLRRRLLHLDDLVSLGQLSADNKRRCDVRAMWTLMSLKSICLQNVVNKQLVLIMRQIFVREVQSVMGGVDRQSWVYI